MVKLSIDGQQVEVEEGTKIFEAAEHIGISIPTMCYLKGINEIGSCRICVVEIEGRDRLAASCNTQVEEGMVVRTRTKKVLDAVKTNISLMLANHRAECTTCNRSTNCVLQKLAKDFSVKEDRYIKQYSSSKWDAESPLQRDDSKCIKCMRCIAVCSEVQGCNVWSFVNSGHRINVGVHEGENIREAGCSLCGQCIVRCPVGALNARNDIDEVLGAIDDPSVITIANVAPAVRSSWGDDVGIPQEEATVGKMVATLKRIGFDYVFDTNFAADLTVMEEASEFLERFTHKEDHVWPMFTSCCPGWVRTVESRHQDIFPQLSSAKSPQQMFGAVIKNYFAEKLGVEPEKIFYTSIMPCVAKKQEAAEPDYFSIPDVRDIDAVLTVREFARTINLRAIDPRDLEEAEWDMPFGDASGAGALFGVSGGVSEAALRTAHYFLTGENPNLDEFVIIEDRQGWKEKTVNIAGNVVRLAVVSGLKNTDKLLEAIDNGEVEYDFVEVMACPGGCSGGGGQTIRMNQELTVKRSVVLKGIDEKQPVRFAHDNPAITHIYEEFLGEPLGDRAKKLLHVEKSIALHDGH